MFSLAPLLQVAIGGAIGSVLRHLAALAFAAPWAVMGINILGSFCIGVLYVILATRLHLSPLLMTGLLGGFTTFSAFSLDALKLWEAGRPLAADRKSTRLNSSHVKISYAVFCLKKKKKKINTSSKKNRN